jgi:hypothetical protein
LTKTLIAAALIAAALPARSAITYGDANGDGLISLQDVASILSAAAGLSPHPDAARHSADVAPVNDFTGGSFGDGRITVADAVRVAWRIANPAAADFPAKRGGYLLEVGNSYTFREYSAAGTALTGPGSGQPDDTTVIDHTATETANGQPTTAYILTSTDGSEQHFINTTYTDGRAAIGITQGTFGGTATTFDPPLLALVYPLEAGQTWTGATKAAGLNATYNARIDGPETVTVPAGTFDTAYKVTINYTAPLFAGLNVTGYEKVWFVPFLGPIQRGFSKAVPFSSTTTIDPQAKLASAIVHGVVWP